MPDFIDRVQDRVEADNERAILAHRLAVEPAARTCVCGCGDAVEPARYAAGACRTLECQRVHEASERQYGR